MANTSRTVRDLGFRQEAEAAFEFLRSEYGFRLISADETFLRYESEKVFVNVYHGRSSFSVRFEIGLLSSPESRYYPEEVVALNSSTEEAFLQASTPERVSRLVPCLAELLRRHGQQLLSGDVVEFARLQEVRDRQATAVTRDYFLSVMREKADLAWKQRDYAALAEALNAIDHDMSPVERRKLQYALEKLGRVN